MQKIRLIALDLDLTLFNSKNQISERNMEAIRYAFSKGVSVMIATGRPLSGVPFDQLADLPIRYVLTVNGAAVYEMREKKLLFENPLPDKTVREVLQFLLTKRVFISVFADGYGLTPDANWAYIPDLIVPEATKQGYQKTRKHVPDILSYLTETGQHVHKIGINFMRRNGVFTDREETVDWLSKNPDIDVVCGGFYNQELTKPGVDKGYGLMKLAEYLHLDPSETMAMGDSENDLSMVKAAGIGVAMGNSQKLLLDAADYVSASNEEDGVAEAIYRFIH